MKKEEYKSLSATAEVTLAHVFKAAARIKPLVAKTPLMPATPLAKSCGAWEVFLKLESLQKTGSFKVRGAANKILSLSQEEKDRGVITFSTGNHGRAVAYIASKLQVKATVCLSQRVPAYRAELVRSLGGHVEVKGRSQDEAEKHYYQVMEEKNMVPVAPFDDTDIIAGQGTIGLEMLKENPGLDILLVPLSGGGLLAGVAVAAKAINPDIKVVGISIENSPAMLESLKVGKPVEVEEKDSLADSLLGGIGQKNHYTLPLIRDLVDEHVLVSEEEIAAGMFYALSNHSLVVEGGAAVGIAALLRGKIDCYNKSVGVVVSGSSVDMTRYLETMNRQLAK